MDTTLDVVRRLSALQVIAVANELFSRAYSAVPFEAVNDNASGSAQLQPLLALDESALRSTLPAQDSERLARALLEQYAQDPGFEPLVRECADAAVNDNLFVELLLTAGLLVNLTLLIATTRVEFVRTANGDTTVKITKAEASPEIVKVAVNAIIEAVKQSAGVGAGGSD